MSPGRTSLDRAGLARLRDGVVAVRAANAVFEVKGAGALTCLQGLLTGDLEKPGPETLVYGAILTPKGSIVADYWVLRLRDRFLLVTEPEGREPTAELLRRSLPPRLATARDRSNELAAAWMYGPGAGDALARSGHAHPPIPGRVTGTEDCLVARPHPEAPFSLLMLGREDPLAAALAAGGIPQGDESDREAARILAGWPRLGMEIRERTLVQEVRFDQIGGVSYTKGCYTGQETVARLHFRGHTNRELRGLVWEGVPAAEEAAVLDADGREAGEVRSVLDLPDRTVGLGLLRSGVEPGARVQAAGQPASVVTLPFTWRDW